MLSCESQRLRGWASKLPFGAWIGHRILWKLTAQRWKNSKHLGGPVREQLCLSVGSPFVTIQNDFTGILMRLQGEPKMFQGSQGMVNQIGCIIPTNIYLQHVACHRYDPEVIVGRVYCCQYL